ncbi:hypothetical protein P40081_14945 [Paenibacillus sp. FSL P4-0081]|jgi:hypothetical protein|uniref:FRG domain-containing protein n=1 Tax=unclassified Paenibacillus TaxID=185978 RepID=UPI0004F5E78A|nr:FRG domain-containing protein [Paenibacillus sp. FSL P4-0081]AIQ29305.1 hypothetical protein P40081_14945 [Paenibacillus sp. FSL P4-0081]
MSYKYTDKQIKSISDLLKHLKPNIGAYDGPIWYRGQSDKTWKLEPSYARVSNRVSESNLIKKFKQSATMLLNPLPANEFNWLFIMQHHGVPTRLLDWSESPLTALYFCASGEADKDGALWVLLPVELNKHSNIEPTYTYDIPSFEDVLLKNYSPESIAGETTSKLYPLAAIAPRNSTRMQSQLGAFTIDHRNDSTIENIGDKKHVWRYIVPSSCKQSILEELSLLGISKFQLFPEMQSIGEILRSV